MSLHNSATNMLKHTPPKSNAIHTPHCQCWNSFDGCLANMGIKILQMFRNGKNDDPSVLQIFSYEDAWVHRLGSDTMTHPALPVLKGVQWLPHKHQNEYPPYSPQRWKGWSEHPPEIELERAWVYPLKSDAKTHLGLPALKGSGWPLSEHQDQNVLDVPQW